MNEAPEQGAQALGRGGAFVAKADDASAIYHNVAGLAAQEAPGTKVMLGANLQASTFTFQRAGVRPGPASEGAPADPEAGRPYALVENVGTPGALPMLSIVSNLGTKRLGVGFGVFAPTANVGKKFPATVGSGPSPARYDAVSRGDAVVLLPTAALAYAISDDVRIGVAGHVLYGRFDEWSTLNSWNKSKCYVEDPRCDSEAHVAVQGMGFAGSLGALVRLTPEVEVGAQVRTGGVIHATGGSPSPTKINDAELQLWLPWTARAGLRWVEREGGRELYDLELDAVWEGWSASNRSTATIAGLEPRQQDFGFSDTIGVRAGGAYAFLLGERVLSLRGGGYVESAGSDAASTRMAFDTLAKVGATLGLGLRTGALGVSVAYAATASVPRLVTDGRFRSDEDLDKGAPAYNNGEYRGFSHTLSLGVEVDVGRIFGGAAAPVERPSDPAPAEDTLEETSWNKTPRAPSRSRRAASASAP